MAKKPGCTLLKDKIYFEPLRADASKVSLDMEFEFASPLLRVAVEPVFKQIANSLVDAFCKRAVELYGKR